MGHFSTRLSRSSLGYTALVLLGLAGTGLVSLLRGEPGTAGALLLATCALLSVGLFSVRGYELDEGRLLIRRPLWNTEIGLDGLMEASLVPKLIRFSSSVWSTRGLFGFIGYGYAASVGTYRAYVTNSAKAVLLRFRSGPAVVISPDSPDAFLSEVGRQVSEP